MRGGGKMLDDEGRVVEGGGKGYRYFGRARELPGVKELFEAATQKPEKEKGETRYDLRAKVDAGYYGYNLDEEDGTLLKYEAEKEREAFEKLLAEEDESQQGEWETLPGDAGDGVSWKLPSAEEVEAELLERRKRKLLDKL